ncbi:glycosyltransferase [Sphingobacterium paramultivorum]|uniref:Glycosyltransferase n=1 Tax=Sphingobacterium paramultivorum TaxID=2886510 RepID=A0A7G5E704_9SPHI|nr:glycosyltransferase [Sphingobacterium paramultivorum]QMV69779.1 glycosyltransferase [Sphingobacterium paramultivorum]WSO13604.1 glycosyltransferase [Sphingobacterium paramultivorum]
MEQPKLSIIIPVYNAEKYLNACIGSILSQSFRDFEIILVNDGSTDGSGAICDSFTIKDKRIKVFHKENGGVSSARNLGLDHALGEWIYFIDADDDINLSCLDFLSTRSLTGIDVVQFGFKTVEENKPDKEQLPLETKEFKDLDEFYNSGSLKNYTLWIHLIRRSIISDHNIRFNTSIKYAEDLEFVICALSVSRRVMTISIIGYHYYIRGNSAMARAFSYNNAKNHLIVAANILDFYEDLNLVKGIFFRSRIEYMIKSFFSFSARAGKLNAQNFKRDIDSHLKSYSYKNILGLKFYYLIRFFPFLYLNMIRFKGNKK